MRTALISAAEQVGDPTLLHEAGKPLAHPESTRFALAKAQASQVGPGSRQTYVGRWWVFIRLVDSRRWGMGCTYRLSPLFALGHLVDITLRNNRLRCVPRELLHCASLQRLDVSHNYLIVLPGDMGHLQQLATLDVSDNEVGSSNHWYRRQARHAHLRVVCDSSTTCHLHWAAASVCKDCRATTTPLRLCHCRWRRAIDCIASACAGTSLAQTWRVPASIPVCCPCWACCMLHAPSCGQAPTSWLTCGRRSDGCCRPMPCQASCPWSLWAWSFLPVLAGYANVCVAFIRAHRG